MGQVTSNILVFFFIMVLSFLVKKRQLMPENTISVLTALLFNITLPALIFSSVVRGPGLEILREGIALIGIALTHYVVVCLVAVLWLRKVSKSNPDAGVFAFAAIFANTSFMGLPLVYLLFGESGVVLGAIYDLVQTLFMFTLGIMFLGGKEEGVLKTFQSQLKEPPVIALLLGLIVLLAGIKLPVILLEPFKMLGSTTSVLAMFAIGQYMEPGCFKDWGQLKKLVPLVAIKLVVVPLAILGLASFLPLTTQVKGVLAIMLASPTAILAAVFAEKYKQDYKFAVMAVVATTGLSILTLPFILSLL